MTPTSGGAAAAPVSEPWANLLSLRRYEALLAIERVEILYLDEVKTRLLKPVQQTYNLLVRHRTVGLDVGL